LASFKCFENLTPKLLQNALQFTKDFGFQIQNHLQKGFCFQMKTISSCFPILQKEKGDFVSKTKLLPKLSFDPKNHYLKKNSFPKWHLNLLYKILVRKNVFNWYLNMFPKNLGLQKTK